MITSQSSAYEMPVLMDSAGRIMVVYGAGMRRPAVLFSCGEASVEQSTSLLGWVGGREMKQSTVARTRKKSKMRLDKEQVPG